MKNIYKKIFVLVCLLVLSTPAKNQKTLSIYIYDDQRPIEYKILNLKKEIIHEFKEGVDNIDLDIENMQNELLSYSNHLGTLKAGHSDWNESEQLMLDIQTELKALQEKIKLKGDWGQLHFNVIDLRGEDPGKVKIRYNYGF
jgi:peptidoglycan hydrolase CwlO-like protein